MSHPRDSVGNLYVHPRQHDPETGPNGHKALHSPHETQHIPAPDLLDLLSTSSQLLIVDVRPLGLFLESHFPRSANISIPSLIVKRFRKPSQSRNATWESLAGFVSTAAGKQVWDGLDTASWLEVVVVGLTNADELARILSGIMEVLVEKGRVRVLEGGWAAVLSSTSASRELVSGELSVSKNFPKSAIPSNSSNPQDWQSPTSPPLSHRPSMPLLRASEQGTKNLPSISVPKDPARRPPKLSLNLDKPLRSTSLPPEPLQSGIGLNKLSINVGESNRLSPGLRITAPKTPLGSSFQTLCHAQSKLPPSPSSFGDVKRLVGPDEDLQPSATARPVSASPAIAPFIVSTVLPSFLFLGPEICSREDVEVLKGMGIKRILNVAIECNDDEGLMLRRSFERYLRIPMRDIVEESGVAKGMREACDFLGEWSRVVSADPQMMHDFTPLPLMSIARQENPDLSPPSSPTSYMPTLGRSRRPTLTWRSVGKAYHRTSASSLNSCSLSKRSLESKNLVAYISRLPVIRARGRGQIHVICGKVYRRLGSAVVWTRDQLRQNRRITVCQKPEMGMRRQEDRWETSVR